VELVVLNDEDFGYWKNRTRNYLLESGTCHLGDRPGGVRDPSNAM
jgi:hypothetical protein